VVFDGGESDVENLSVRSERFFFMKVTFPIRVIFGFMGGRVVTSKKRTSLLLVVESDAGSIVV